jgi:hypothetical protein
MKKKLTIGIATHDDFDGIFFTIQSIRLYHPEVLKDLEFVIIDNNPEGACGNAIRNLCKNIREPVQYIPFTKYKTTAIRSEIFHFADTSYVLVLDGHVLLRPGSLSKLINFFNFGYDEGNLLQGPLLYDDLSHISTHFDPVWRDQMWGIWATDERGKHEDNPPFEIPMQGLGIFACRKLSWPGFNKHFRGFGGEEGYIHQKFKLAGKKTLCLPFLRWVHRFDRPNGVSYPLKQEDRILNYFLGHVELGMDCEPIFEHFKKWQSMEVLTELHKTAKSKTESSFLEFSKNI